ncbi:MAG: FAD-dependent thymidylate synthase [Deltaproteobacteria bacterium]|nr:FAD-dependent thymidylate synthase [Deltaproteobacteria bacterium]MBI2974740.1 FAD-dependent thymidylate synthase [Deltaproteobacteria bacterium]
MPEITDTIKCLDQGFVRLVDVMGDDSSIVQAARVSYGKGTKNVRQDKGLIHYLMKHQHMSPFEMVEFKFHCKMPVFVARQWIRHRTANVNEISGRYSVMEDAVWEPKPADLRQQAKINRQGSLDAQVPEPANSEILKQYSHDIETIFKHYNEYIQKGVAREVARAILPLATYTEWYWKMDLHNLLHFLALRMEAHAQKEIRVYAEAIAEFVKQKCPFTWEAFVEHRLNAAKFSQAEVEVLRGELKKTGLIDKILDQRKSQLAQNEASEALIQTELAEFRAKLTGEKIE